LITELTVPLLIEKIRRDNSRKRSLSEMELVSSTGLLSLGKECRTKADEHLRPQSRRLVPDLPLYADNAAQDDCQEKPRRNSRVKMISGGTASA
jgi:hypothetical protein